ncbi:MAG: PAS domain S-box protein [Victivallales bacterium]|nr:PAS domain S-box protein [Victivallales bacterium]
METLFTCALALLEITFIFVGLMLLHSLRHQIGSASFYLSLGVLLIFTQLVGATELKVNLGYQGVDFFISSTVLFLPYLAVLMVVYITDGTLPTQRVIIGIMTTLGLYLYLSQLTAVQCGWSGYSISQGPSADSLEYLLRQSMRTLAGSIFAQTLDLFLLPIFFQRLRNLNCRLFLSVLLAFMLTQIIHTLLYVSVTFWGQPEFWMHLRTSYISNAFVSIWLSMLVTLYLSKIEREIPGEGRGALDIVFAFFGSYGKAQRLEKNLQEWEGRYRMVVENASDLILLVDKDGRVLDANLAALQTFSITSLEEIKKKVFPEDFLPAAERGKSGIACQLLGNRNFDDTQYIVNTPLSAESATGRKLDLDISVSKVEVEGTPVTVVFGRDVTEQNRASREREELREQLTHTQRLESIGELAGGVAHDFNNYLHAIQGHIDILTYMHNIEDEKVNTHLQRIDNITEQAAELTRKLLGFARKGKYIEKDLDLNEVVKTSIDLFMPASQENLELDLKSLLKNAPIRGDELQLNQAFLNILINARYAMRDNPDERMRIDVEISDGKSFASKCKGSKTGSLSPAAFYCVRIRDYGKGISKDIINRIFDPFFSTRPLGEGTGLGLSMVYGTVSNHGGFVQVESEEGKGSSFYVFLPKGKNV